MRAKQICVLLLAQAGCVAVGLWMQHRHAVFSLCHAVEEETWSRLERQVNDIAGQLDGITVGDLVPGSLGFQKARTCLARAPSDPAGALIVDDQRRVIAHFRAAGQAQLFRLPQGEPLPWSPSPEVRLGTGGALAGTLDLPGGPHIAVQHPLSAGQGFVLLHYPAAAIGARSAGLTRSLPGIGVVALFWTMGILTITAFVVLGRFHERAEQQRAQAATETLRQAQNLVRTRDAVIFGLAKLAESRDDDTGEHLERISTYSTMLASALRRHPKYMSGVTATFVRLIGISAALHDIGKVGIEDEILLKPRSLTAGQRVRMQAHTLIGGRCLQEIEQRLGTSNFLQMAREIALAHHERWDGRGYPKGLAGDSIPLAARIVAIADVYDALSSERVYKPQFPHEECVAIIRSEAGKQFDPDLVEVWLTVTPRFREIARRYTPTERMSSEPSAGSSAPPGCSSGDEETQVPSVDAADDELETSPELSRSC